MSCQLCGDVGKDRLALSWIGELVLKADPYTIWSLLSGPSGSGCTGWELASPVMLLFISNRNMKRPSVVHVSMHNIPRWDEWE